MHARDYISWKTPALDSGSMNKTRKQIDADFRKRHPERCRAKSKAYRKRNAKACKARCASWRSRNLEKARALSRAWNAANPERMKAAWDRKRFKKYGMTRDDFEELFKLQGCRCAGCGSYDPKGKDWHIDHEHKTKHVRGILCSGCNSAIGFAKDNPQTLRNLADYVQFGGF